MITNLVTRCGVHTPSVLMPNGVLISLRGIVIQHKQGLSVDCLPCSERLDQGYSCAAHYHYTILFKPKLNINRHFPF